MTTSSHAIDPGPETNYAALVEEGKMRPGDANQEKAVGLLQDLHDQLAERKRNQGNGGGLTTTEALSGGASLWDAIMGAAKSQAQEPTIKGLYLYGGVGTGKTMLMDMFFNTAPVRRKTRIHFHDLMLQVHSRLRNHRGSSDPLDKVAEELAEQAKLLCLDELMVTDVADATILNRLFGGLWDRGVIVVSTSNRMPDDLYKNGLQRQLFLPFIERLKSTCIVHDINSSVDYRKLGTLSGGTYFVGQGAAENAIDFLRQSTNATQFASRTISIQMGREMRIEQAMGDVACFSFKELCEQPLGAADYIAICENFHTIAVLGIPKFKAANRTSAYRFTTLVDVVYEHRFLLVCTAEAGPLELFEKVIPLDEAKARGSAAMEGDDALLVDDNLGFTKDRTISRLTEMQTEEYRSAHYEEHRLKHT